uniref:Uncharacterized protein n=3 Tax=unclassified Prevotella TaxID=2638335 RepID=A0AB33JEE3_9BACT
MKELVGKFIHLLIMPCNRVPLLIEKRNVGRLHFFLRMRLNAHLMMCKWCAAYAEKVERIDNLLTKKYEKDMFFEDTEIQSFKEDVKKKMK